MSNVYSPDSPLNEIMSQYMERLHADPDRLISFCGNMKADETNERGAKYAFDDDQNASVSSIDLGGGDMAYTDTPSYKHFIVNYQTIEVGAEVDDKSMHHTSKGSIVNATREGVKKRTKALTDWLDFFLGHGNGTQEVGAITGAAVGLVIPMDGVADGIGSYFLRPRQRIRIYDATLATLRGTATITAKVDNVSMTVDAVPAGVVAGDKVLIDGVGTVGIKGLPYLINDIDPYFNQDRNTNPNIRSVVDKTAGAMSFTKLQRNWLSMKQRDQKAARKCVSVTSTTQEAQYLDLVRPEGATATHRYNYEGGSRPAADIGLQTLDLITWFGTKVKVFNNVKPNAWYFLHKKSLKKVVFKPEGTVDNKGAGEWLRALNTTGGYRHAFQSFSNLACEFFSPSPHTCGGLTNLDITNLPQMKDSDWIGGG